MKKVLTLVLAICLIIGMCVPAMAATIKPGKVVGFRPDLIEEADKYDLWDQAEMIYSGGAWFQTDKNNNWFAYDDTMTSLDDLVIFEGDKLYFHLLMIPFEYANQEAIENQEPGDDVDPSDIFRLSTYSKLKIGKGLGKWGAYVKDVSLQNYKLPEGPYYAPTNLPCVVVEFADTFTNMKEEDFEIKWTMSIGGKKATVNLAGTFSFEEVEVDADQEDATAGAGVVLKPQGHARNIALELEEGVTLTTTLNKGRNARAWATSREVDEFDPLYESHKGLEFIYTVNVIGIAHGTVKLDIADPQLHVYDAEGKYLGTTKDELPLGKYYFLCNYQAESIVPPQLEEDKVEVSTTDMTLAEYITFLKTGELPERLKAVEEPEGEPAAEDTAEGEVVPEATANASLGGE